MFSSLETPVSMLNMIRNKSNYEKFESNLVSSKQACTQRLIKKFNLDKTNNLANVNTGLVDVARMDQVKTLNYPLLTKKLDNRIGGLTHSLASNSVKNGAPTIMKTLNSVNNQPSSLAISKNQPNQGDEYLNVYYNTHDIKIPYVVSSSSQSNQRPTVRVMSRQSHEEQPSFKPNCVNSDYNDNLTSYSTFDFTTPLSSRKKEEEAQPSRREHRIVTITHRPSERTKKKSSSKSKHAEPVALFADTSSLTLNTDFSKQSASHFEDSSQNSMSIQKIRRPDIFELRSQNHILVKSTSNLSSNTSFIDLSKTDNRLVNNKYHYYLNSNEPKLSQLDVKKTCLNFLSDDSSRHSQEESHVRHG